jgi:hypothetical protein
MPYQIAHKRGMIPQITSHMEREKMRWTDQELADEAAKYSVIKDFRTQSPEAYSTASRRGLLTQLTQNMERTGKIPYFFDDKDLAQEALKYDTLKDFRTQSERHYQAALKRGLDFLNRITSHMERGTRDWTDEELAQEASKHDKLSHFRVQNPAAYQSAYARGILDQITGHMDKKRHLQKWTDEGLAQEASKYARLKDFMEQSPNAYAASIRRGDIFPKITAHMERQEQNQWTDEELRQEALKYTTIKEFRTKNYNAYKVALRRKSFPQITAHLEKEREEWTDEKLAQEAAKYTTLKDFREQSKSAYQAAWRRGILPQITSQMAK